MSSSSKPMITGSEGRTVPILAAIRMLPINVQIEIFYQYILNYVSSITWMLTITVHDDPTRPSDVLEESEFDRWYDSTWLSCSGEAIYLACRHAFRSIKPQMCLAVRNTTPSGFPRPYATRIASSITTIDYSQGTSLRDLRAAMRSAVRDTAGADSSHLRFLHHTPEDFPPTIPPPEADARAVAGVPPRRPLMVVRGKQRDYLTCGIRGEIDILLLTLAGIAPDRHMTWDKRIEPLAENMAVVVKMSDHTMYAEWLRLAVHDDGSLRIFYVEDAFGPMPEYIINFPAAMLYALHQWSSGPRLRLREPPLRNAKTVSLLCRARNIAEAGVCQGQDG